MHIGVCTLHLRLLESRSLKEKRRAGLLGRSKPADTEADADPESMEVAMAVT